MEEQQINYLNRIKQYEIAFKLDYQKIVNLQEEIKNLLEENNKLKNDLKLYTLNKLYE